MPIGPTCGATPDAPRRGRRASLRRRGALRAAAGARPSFPLAALILVLTVAGCGGSQAANGTTTSASTTRSGDERARAAAARHVSRRAPVYPLVRLDAMSQTGPQFVPVVLLRGRVAAWRAQRSGVTLTRFDARLVQLALHAGSLDPGGAGWSHGDRVAGGELHHLVAAFNGGFRLNTRSGGFFAENRTPVALYSGFGSIVTYSDGSTQIGAWQSAVPAAGKVIASVRQNLRLLIDAGAPVAALSSCPRRCWGATLGGGISVPRSALGVTASGDLVYAAGVGLSPAQLANAMAAAGVQEAVELDINPQWVAGYLYRHSGGGTPAAIPLVPGQVGITGFFLAPYSRDFFAIVAR